MSRSKKLRSSASITNPVLMWVVIFTGQAFGEEVRALLSLGGTAEEDKPHRILSKAKSVRNVGTRNDKLGKSRGPARNRSKGMS